jgi:hypothetical protein
LQPQIFRQQECGAEQRRIAAEVMKFMGRVPIADLGCVLLERGNDSGASP